MSNREIDKLVAEKVMGWEVKELNGYGNPFVDKYNNNGEYPFSPSTNIKDAWLVVEKLNERWEFEVYKDNGDKNYWCDFSGYDKFCYVDRFYRGVSETAQMAICLAALKSVGVEI